MRSKLTLYIDDQLVRRAKDYARKPGTSVSKIVADFFRVLDRPAQRSKEEDLTPTVRSLVGVMNKRSGTENDYYRYLKRKHLSYYSEH